MVFKKIVYFFVILFPLHYPVSRSLTEMGRVKIDISFEVFIILENFIEMNFFFKSLPSWENRDISFQLGARRISKHSNNVKKKSASRSVNVEAVQLSSMTNFVIYDNMKCTSHKIEQKRFLYKICKYTYFFFCVTAFHNLITKPLLWWFYQHFKVSEKTSLY